MSGSDGIHELKGNAFQEFVENMIRRDQEKKGYRDVFVGVPFPHGEDVAANLEEEVIIATVSHSEGEKQMEIHLQPYLQAFVLSQWKSIGKPDIFEPIDDTE